MTIDVLIFMYALLWFYKEAGACLPHCRDDKTEVHEGYNFVEN